jgi:hypothetical protein
MKCNLCYRTFRLTAYNNSGTCSTCLDVAEPDNIRDEDTELEINLLLNCGKVKAVFDTEGSDYNNDDYGHGY